MTDPLEAAAPQAAPAPGQGRPPWAGKPRGPKPENLLRASPDGAHEALREQLLDESDRVQELETEVASLNDAVNDLLQRVTALEPPA